MLALVMSLAAAQASPCGPGELVVLSCGAKERQIAVCAGPSSPDPAWLQVRFTPPGKPALVFPATRGGFGMFHLSRQVLATGDAASLRFRDGKTTYEVWTQTGKDGGAGVNVIEGGETKAQGCGADYVEHWELVEPFLNGAVPTTTTTTTATAARPAPLAGKSQKDICNDDALLLLQHGWDDLRFNGAFEKVCCVKSALGDDDRCHLDWPSSDVPPCSDIDALRNKLFALYATGSKIRGSRRSFRPSPGTGRGRTSRRAGCLRSRSKTRRGCKRW